MPTGSIPESLSQGILAGTILVGRLGVAWPGSANEKRGMETRGRLIFAKVENTFALAADNFDIPAIPHSFQPHLKFPYWVGGIGGGPGERRLQSSGILHYSTPRKNPLLFYSERGILYYSTPRKESFTILPRERNPLLFFSERRAAYEVWALTGVIWSSKHLLNTVVLFDLFVLCVFCLHFRKIFRTPHMVNTQSPYYDYPY